MMWIIYRIM